jgi:hypothetical protein
MVRYMLKLDSLEKRIFSGLILAVVGMVLLYAYLVSRTIFNVVARKNLESHIADLSSEISDLEFSYIAAKGSITKEFAYARGFTDATQAIFVRRDSGAALSYSRSAR